MQIALEKPDYLCRFIFLFESKFFKTYSLIHASFYIIILLVVLTYSSRVTSGYICQNNTTVSS